jgi:hypothetical protein
MLDFGLNMKGIWKRFSMKQIVGVLKQAQAEVLMAQMIRKTGSVSSQQAQL